MNKLLLSTLLCISSIAGANAYPTYTCDEIDEVKYEVEQLAEDAKDVQFDTPTRMQIVNEYYHMATEAKRLTDTCQPKKEVKSSDNEFTLNGITYIVVTEYNSKY